MTQADADSQFLVAGLRHFPDAHATVGAFRRIVAEKVEAILRASRPDVWSSKEVKPTRAESNGLWVGAGGPMALVAMPGKVLSLDVGICWGSSYFPERVMAVADVYSASEVIGQRVQEPAGERVRVVRVGSRQDRFATPVSGESSDVEHAFHLVVEAAAIGVADAIARRPNAADT